MVVVWIKFADIGVWCRSRGDLPKMFFGMIEACDFGISLSLPSMILSDGCHQRFGELRKFGKPMHRHEELPARRSASRSATSRPPALIQKKLTESFLSFFPSFCWVNRSPVVSFRFLSWRRTKHSRRTFGVIGERW